MAQFADSNFLELLPNNFLILLRNHGSVVGLVIKGARMLQGGGGGGVWRCVSETKAVTRVVEGHCCCCVVDAEASKETVRVPQVTIVRALE